MQGTSRMVSRREALKQGAVVSGACLSNWLFGGSVTVVAGQSPERDLTILTAALYLEHEAIAAYTAGAGSGLLPADVLAVASAFMDDHQYHRDGIAGVIRSLGQTPADTQPRYRFQNKAVLGFAANIMADEVRHATVLRSVLGLRNH